MSLFNSFSFLWGPWEHLKHLLSLQRLPFTLIYLGTAVGTLLCAIKVRFPCCKVGNVDEHNT